MKKTLLPAKLLVVLGAACIFSAPKPPAKAARNAQSERSKALNSPQTKWIEKSLKKMQAVKVGMTRAQLWAVFTTEGGVSSRKWQRFVFRECPYIKVDVEFKPAAKSKKYPHSPSRDDVITKISQPFLEWSIED
jgi:hypothetical protein